MLRAAALHDLIAQDRTGTLAAVTEEQILSEDTLDERIRGARQRLEDLAREEIGQDPVRQDEFVRAAQNLIALQNLKAGNTQGGRFHPENSEILRENRAVSKNMRLEEAVKNAAADPEIFGELIAVLRAAPPLSREEMRSRLDYFANGRINAMADRELEELRSMPGGPIPQDPAGRQGTLDGMVRFAAIQSLRDDRAGLLGNQALRYTDMFSEAEIAAGMDAIRRNKNLMRVFKASLGSVEEVQKTVESMASTRFHELKKRLGTSIAAFTAETDPVRKQEIKAALISDLSRMKALRDWQKSHSLNAPVSEEELTEKAGEQARSNEFRALTRLMDVDSRAAASLMEQVFLKSGSAFDRAYEETMALLSIQLPEAEAGEHRGRPAVERPQEGPAVERPQEGQAMEQPREADPGKTPREWFEECWLNRNALQNAGENNRSREEHEAVWRNRARMITAAYLYYKGPQKDQRFTLAELDRLADGYLDSKESRRNLVLDEMKLDGAQGVVDWRHRQLAELLAFAGSGEEIRDIVAFDDWVQHILLLPDIQKAMAALDRDPEKLTELQTALRNGISGVEYTSRLYALAREEQKELAPGENRIRDIARAIRPVPVEKPGRERSGTVKKATNLIERLKDGSQGRKQDKNLKPDRNLKLDKNLKPDRKKDGHLSQSMNQNQSTDQNNLV